MVQGQGQTVQESQLAALIFTGTAIACMMVAIVNKISLSKRHSPQRHNHKNQVDVEAGRKRGMCSAMCLCETIAGVICAPKDKMNTKLDYFDRSYAETVKSMDISDSGNDNISLPQEVNAAALATAQFLSAEGNLNSLTLSERTHIAENRQVMKAYLISKLVAPKYQIEDGKINMQKNIGHLDRFEHYNRQSAMFDLVFNGQITVDTRATKKQQRDAIKRLKKSSKDRHLEKQEKISVSEKETSGLGTEATFPSPVNDHKEERTSKLPIFKRLASVIKNKGQDSAVGSSIGQYDADIESIEKAKNRTLREAQRAQEQVQSRTSNSSSDREGNEEDLEPIREETCYKESISEDRNQQTIEPQPIFSQSDFTSSSSQSRTVSKNPSETSCESSESSSDSATSDASTLTH
ncbi:unnamed protein product [Oikopleura dioica]|uniref:Uncharacterized protein n=1 Tax=Oikopleura dioica TaxID=34765 RepID=E4XGE0_OIKDI|nr:unnamed protein product [Oikopleura dioica]